MTLSHHRVGSGEPLVLLHGTGSQWQFWRPLFDRLARHREVIAVDLPGFGESPLPGEPAVLTPQAHADAVAAFLDDLGIERPVVAGNSLGGGVALELARRGRARAAVPISPVGFWTPREQRWCVNRLRVERVLGEHILERAPWIFRAPSLQPVLMAGMIGYPLRIPAPVRHQMLCGFSTSPGFDATVAGLERYTFARGEEIRVPVTVVWGTRDYLLLPRQGYRARRVIPGAQLVRLPRAGHGPTYDATDALVRVLCDS